MKKEISVEMHTRFKGKRKIGLDTNILIKLYDEPILFAYEQARIFNEEDTIFTHRICRIEFIRWLKNNYKLDDKGAEAESNKFLSEHKINCIGVFIPEKEVYDFESKCNDIFKSQNKPYLKCHAPDSIIVLGFAKEGINKIISTDESFRESAKILGIDGERLPNLNDIIKRQLRKTFDRNYKH